MCLLISARRRQYFRRSRASFFYFHVCDCERSVRRLERCMCMYELSGCILYNHIILKRQTYNSGLRLHTLGIPKTCSHVKPYRNETHKRAGGLMWLPPTLPSRAPEGTPMHTAWATTMMTSLCSADPHAVRTCEDGFSCVEWPRPAAVAHSRAQPASARQIWVGS